MDINSQLKRPKVWFEVDVESKDGTEQSRQVAFSGPLSIGYRQLDAERWPTTRYHLLAFASRGGPLPRFRAVALHGGSTPARGGRLG